MGAFLQGHRDLGPLGRHALDSDRVGAHWLKVTRAPRGPERRLLEAAEAAEVSPPPAPLRRELQASESGEVGRSRPG